MSGYRRAWSAFVLAAVALGACADASPTAPPEPLGSSSGRGGPGLRVEAPVRAEAAVSPAVTPASAAVLETRLADPVLPVCADGQVAAILAAESEARRRVATAVAPRLSDPLVRAYALGATEEQTRLTEDLERALDAADVTTFDNAVARAIRDSADLVIAGLADKRGTDLDRAYVEWELLGLSRALGVADHFLGPSIFDSRLHAAARHARDASAMRLVLAHDLVRRLDGTCGGVLP